MTRSDESLQGKSLRRRDRTWGVVSSRQKTRVGCINVTSLGDLNTDGRAEMAMNTLKSYGVDICGLSEVRWAESGRVRVAEYEIFYSGNDKGGMYGVGVAVDSKLVEGVSAWQPVSDCIMWIRFNAKNVPTTIIQAYAPTDVANSDTKDEFYCELERVLMSVPGRNFLIVLGDLNARVGNDARIWSGVVGRHGVAE